jgi:epsilon-lactone hydrolase
MYLPRFLINFFVRQGIQKKIAQLDDPVVFRKYMDAVGAKSSRLPKEVAVTRLPTTPELVTLGLPNARQDAVILYLHGGGYVFGSFATHGMLMAKLAKAAQMPVVHVEYRLSPEHPYPAAVEDAVFAYQWVRTNYPQSKIYVGGDSAGAGLTLALMQKLRTDALTLADGIFLFSPWTDLSGTLPAVKNNGPTEYMLAESGLHQAAAAYAPCGDVNDPMLSPIHANYQDMPSMLVQFVPHEILADDARTVIARAREAGVTVTATEWPGNAHAFQTLGNLRDADRAIAEVAQWLARVGNSE